MFKTSVPGSALQGHFRWVHYGFTLPVSFVGLRLYLVPIFSSTFTCLLVRIMRMEQHMFSRRWLKIGTYSKQIFNIQQCDAASCWVLWVSFKSCNWLRRGCWAQNINSGIQTPHPLSTQNWSNITRYFRRSRITSTFILLFFSSGDSI